MFDPIASIRLENQVAGWNRTIKGSRNALNGAVDQGDEGNKGPDLDYHMPMFNLSLGDYGEISVEYWLLARPEKSNSKPTRAFVDDGKPIVLTHNGQNQEELTGRLIRKDAELPFLQTQGRLIVHVNCDRLTLAAKRLLFSSTREKSREGFVRNTIEKEVVNLLKADDELKRFNDQARDQSLRNEDAEAEKQMQRQIAKLLRIVGPAIVDVGASSTEVGSGPPRSKWRPHGKPRLIDLKEPPTYIKILGDQDEEITFYPGQRRYVRIETDANSHYHDPDDHKKSSINIAVGPDLKVFGTSPLRGGRMRIGVQCHTEVALASKGAIRVELYRSGLSALSDERGYKIVEQPKPAEDSRKTTFPQIKMIEVDGPADERWEYVTEGMEDNDVRRHASGTQMDEGIFYIYYSTAYPRFAGERTIFEQKSAALAASFKRRYELWLAVHALLVYDQQQNAAAEADDDAVAQECARQERCRLATIAAMVAAQEVRTGLNTEDLGEAAAA